MHFLIRFIVSFDQRSNSHSVLIFVQQLNITEKILFSVNMACFFHLLLTRVFHELPAPTVDMTVLPGVLGCRTLRRTVQVRLGSYPAVPRIARWHTLIRGLPTVIREISGLIFFFKYYIEEDML